jgi:hypothetical protein
MGTEMTQKDGFRSDESRLTAEKVLPVDRPAGPCLSPANRSEARCSHLVSPAVVRRPHGVPDAIWRRRQPTA